MPAPRHSAHRALATVLATAAVLGVGGGVVRPARAQTPPPARAPMGVLVALPGGILPGENAEVRRALDVYLHDFRAEVEEIGPLPGGMPALIARTIEVAGARDLRLAVVLFWSAVTERRVLTATFVDLRAAEARPVTFTADWPHRPDAAFYRLLGLKLRSTLLAIIGAPPGGKHGGAAAGGHHRPRHAGDDSLRVAVEGLAAGDLAVESRAPVPAFGGAVRIERGRLAAAVTASRGLEERRTYADVQGDTALTKVAGVLALRVAEAGEAFGFWGELHLGALQVRTTERLLATGEAHDHSQWGPYASLVFLVGYDIGDHVRLNLGPRLDVFLVRDWRTFQGTRVYDTGWVQPGIDLRLQVFF
jgi:hypothetical protein